MADRMLMISWGRTIPGREVRALEVFNESLGLYGRMQQEGRVESFEVTLMQPNGLMAGAVMLKGSVGQIAAVRDDAEFRRVCTAAVLIVEDFAITDGYCDQGVADQIGLFQEAISQVPQMA